MTPTTIGNYRMVRELGAGAMGAVYEAVDQMLERTVALKMLRPEIAGQPELIERFRAEAVMLARLSHPSIATLYNFFRQGERYYMVMEFVRGRTLEDAIRSAGRLPPEVAIPILGQVLDAMAHAHAMGVLHRDIKPANIMIHADGTVKVTDFGIARILGSSRMTREGRIIGTLEYIAPERIRGEEADIRSDLYSAGVVLYEMLTGRLPFVADTDYALIQAHLHQAPPELPTMGIPCPPELEQVLRRALEKDPAARYPTAEAFREALARVPAALPLKATRLAGTVPVALPETRLAATAPAGKVNAPWRTMIAGALLLVVVAAVAGFVSWRGRGSRPVVPAPVSTSTTPPAPAEAPAPLPAPAPAAVALAPAFQGAVAPPPASLSAALAAPAEPEPARPAGPRSIHGVRRLFLAPMAQGLDRYLREEIRDELAGRILLAASADEADAVMRGGITRGKDLKARVSITDVEGGKVYWVGEADDRAAILGVGKHGGAKKIAGRLVSQLKKALKK